MRHLLTMVLVGLAALDPGAGFAQAERRLTPEQLKDVDAAIAYFEGGGAWSFRFASSPAAAASGVDGLLDHRPQARALQGDTLHAWQLPVRYAAQGPDGGAHGGRGLGELGHASGLCRSFCERDRRRSPPGLRHQPFAEARQGARS